jgi:hypothetical protein
MTTLCALCACVVESDDDFAVEAGLSQVSWAAAFPDSPTFFRGMQFGAPVFVALHHDPNDPTQARIRGFTNGWGDIRNSIDFAAARLYAAPELGRGHYMAVARDPEDGRVAHAHIRYRGADQGFILQFDQVPAPAPASYAEWVEEWTRAPNDDWNMGLAVIDADTFAEGFRAWSDTELQKILARE